MDRLVGFFGAEVADGGAVDDDVFDGIEDFKSFFSLGEAEFEFSDALIGGSERGAEIEKNGADDDDCGDHKKGEGGGFFRGRRVAHRMLG